MLAGERCSAENNPSWPTKNWQTTALGEWSLSGNGPHPFLAQVFPIHKGLLLTASIKDPTSPGEGLMTTQPQISGEQEI